MLGLPSDMDTFRLPMNDSRRRPGVYRAALDVLRDLLAGHGKRTGDRRRAAVHASVLDLERAVLREANEMLGQGEVSVLAPAQELTRPGDDVHRHLARRAVVASG